MIIDEKIIYPEDRDNIYTFKSVGEHIVKIKLNRNLKTMEGMFKECSDLVEIDLSDLETKDINNTANMFYKCESLTSVNLKNMNTALIKNMSYMFF